jgi:NAD-dependent histone deacetylase SIR2
LLVPDFRSPDTGLYANLERLNLPYAEAVFDIGYFRGKPEPFYVLARELYPGQFHPTVSHAFIALLAAKGILLQLFTQNIDCLERAAGVPEDLIVEAHGSFATQRCIDCQAPFPNDTMRDHVSRGEVPHCKECKGLVKPDIVFFGESLPEAFRARSKHAREADLALILGTSLSVHPFAALPEEVRETVPRVLFNLERVGHLGQRADDVLVLGDCDSGVRKLADALGWREELEEEWRLLVGEKEAMRQLHGAERREQSMRDELDRLADKVDDVLHLQDEDSDETKGKETLVAEPESDPETKPEIAVQDQKHPDDKIEKDTAKSQTPLGDPAKIPDEDTSVASDKSPAEPKQQSTNSPKEVEVAKIEVAAVSVGAESDGSSNRKSAL